jgi:hypothetical protein
MACARVKGKGLSQESGVGEPRRAAIEQTAELCSAGQPGRLSPRGLWDLVPVRYRFLSRAV